MKQRTRIELGLGSALMLALAATAASPRAAHACGGFFCSAASPVNQAAEQIVFADNGDGTVTAVIQILYEGPASKFAWVLPVAGTPEVSVSSDMALATLKRLTNPQYNLTRIVEGCNNSFGNAGRSAGAQSGAGGGGALPTEPNVDQLASGAVGPYDYTVIAVKPGLAMPETVAIEWLAEHGYDVGDLGPEVLRPYLAEGLNLVAFKLQKGSSTGSIRPVMLTYEGSKPSIPIRPTAVAANEDMGVLVWTLGASRSVPANYKALELNEALIDWFNPMRNYNDVVSRAADEAMGQGFVTEYAGPVADISDSLDLFPDDLEENWRWFSSAREWEPLAMLEEAEQQWSGFQGYEDALRAALTLPETIEFVDFRRCAPCYIDDPGVAFDTSLFLTKLYELAIKPIMDTEELLKSRPYITRLYTTMSADEMNVDPVFDFNADLPDVDNVHRATSYSRCGSTTFRVELESAGVVYGDQMGVWPKAVASQPAAMRIMEHGTSGLGRVIEDRTREIIALNERDPKREPVIMPMPSPLPTTRSADGSVIPNPSTRAKRACAVHPADGSEPVTALLLLGCAALLRRRARARG